MFYILLVLVGLVSGTLGGMGMGGGTLLIPLLTFAFGFNQKIVQGINLISFSIMAIIIVCFHIKNKLVDIKTAIGVAVVALVAAGAGAFLASVVKNNHLKFMFGALLIAISIYMCVLEIKKIFNCKKDNKNLSIKKKPKNVEKK